MSILSSLEDAKKAELTRLRAENERLKDQSSEQEGEITRIMANHDRLQAENEKLKTIIQSALWKLPEKPNSAKMKLLEAQNGI